MVAGCPTSGSTALCAQMIFGANDPFLDAVCEGECDVTDTEEAFTLRGEAAAELALWEADRLALPDRGDRGVLRDGDTPAEPEVVVHKDADGNLTGPRQAAHIGTTGGADRLPMPDWADRTEGPVGGVVLDGHTPAELRVAGTEVVLHDDTEGNPARPRQAAPIRATGAADRLTLPVGGWPRAHGATAAAAALPGIEQAHGASRMPDADGGFADGGVGACSPANCNCHANAA